MSSRTSLTGQVALVTGATSGFGEATARRLAGDGARVIATGRRKDRLDRLAADVGDAIHPVVLDVRDRKAVFAAVAALPGDLRDVDVLVNNAGLALGLSPAAEADLDEWDTMVDTNVKGLMYVTRAVLPRMVERGRGLVVNIGSTAALWPYPGSNVYGGTKAFVTQFSYNLRADLTGTGIRVTDLAPGLAETEFAIVRFGGDAERAAGVYEGTEPIRAEDIADTVHWLATSPEHLNVNRIEIMPVCQSFAAPTISRNG